MELKRRFSLIRAMRNRNNPIELWGGVECTVVRLGDDYRDQLEETGHAGRLSDLDAIADLGIRTVRYPILWERIAPDSPDKLDFSWHDERLKRLKELGISVIGGLLHHGSGPRYTELLDPEFPAKLADFARRAAERYPWIHRWTPVNEPVTTARFSCLYGHWYPHRRDFAAFARATVNECAGTLQAMRAIRSIIPNAQLVATEDLGKTFSTEPLAYQARHENHRRWLSLDLLTGRMRPGHAWWDKMLANGIDERLLTDLQSGEGRPDIIGINHYLTSERYLDHRADLYPGHEPGSNGRDTYVDLEAIRMPHLAGKVGPAARLGEAWRRYGIPLAITEVHHGCSREEQVRWMREMWDAAHRAQAAGADIRAVTLWSLFGNVDWRSLLTRRDKIYDVGAFDTRGDTPRPTMVAKAAAIFATGRPFDHPALANPPWWRRPGRFYCGPGKRPDPLVGRPLVITGATGTLGQAFGRLCTHRGLTHLLTDRAQMDITDADSITRFLDATRPWAVINAAGFVRVDEAKERADECFLVNSTGPELLAAACRERGIQFVTFSSDLVFDGQLGRAYREADPTAPACTYGESKAEAEERVLSLDDNALVIRTSAFFGPWDRYNFVWSVLDRLGRGEEVEANAAEVVTPTYVPDLVHSTLDLLLDGEGGVWHLANQGSTSWHDLACEVADRRGLPVRKIRDGGGRTADTSLTSDRGLLLRPLDQALEDYLIRAETLPNL